MKYITAVLLLRLLNTAIVSKNNQLIQQKMNAV